MTRMLLQNATLVTDRKIMTGGILCDDGRIAAIAERFDALPQGEYETLDCRGKYVFPGFVDCHVHFNDPGYTWREDFGCGTKAAALGGIATVLDMPMLNKPPVDSPEQFIRKQEIVSQKAYVDYGFWGALVDYNFGALAGLAQCGAVAFKSFLCPVDEDYTSLTIEQAAQALAILKPLNALAAFHCEDYALIEKLGREYAAAGKTSRWDYLDSRPVEAELVAVRGIIAIAERSGAQVHICHVSHPDVAELIRQAKERGVKITAETCMHYLIYCDEDVIEKGMLLKCSPPIRDSAARGRLWDYVLDGTIDCICSDHSPAAPQEKTEQNRGAFGAWGGISGVQCMAQALFDFAVHKKGCSPMLVAKLLSARPAQIFGISGRKGALEKGFDADFTIVDPDAEWEIKGSELACKHPITGFEGLKGKGKPVCTVVRGRIVAQDGQMPQGEGYGMLIRR